MKAVQDAIGVSKRKNLMHFPDEKIEVNLCSSSHSWEELEEGIPLKSSNSRYPTCLTSMPIISHSLKVFPI